MAEPYRRRRLTRLAAARREADIAIRLGEIRGSGIVPLVNVRVKVCEYDPARAAANQPLETLETISIDVPASSGLDERTATVKRAVAEKVRRRVRSIKPTKLPGDRLGFTAIVERKEGAARAIRRA